MPRPAPKQKNAAPCIPDILIQKMKGHCFLVPDLDDLESMLDDVIEPGDMLITMGAGNIWRYCDSYSKHLNSILEGVEG